MLSHRVVALWSAVHREKFQILADLNFFQAHATQMVQVQYTCNMNLHLVGLDFK
jgi:hypothetical protein